MTQPFALRTAAGSTATGPVRFTFDGVATRALPATRWPRRCWRTTFIWSAVRSSITARAASCPPAPRNQTPWSRSIAGRGGSRPNLRATQVELYDGLIARSQNRFPSLRFDLGATGRAGRAAAVGRVLLQDASCGRRSFWQRLYEPAIRRAAGSGARARGARSDRYLHRYAHCEVLIVGGGPAGLAAALGASATGARVILCDEQAELGGSLLHEPGVTIDGWPAPDWVREAIDDAGRVGHAAAAHHRFRLVSRTT